MSALLPQTNDDGSAPHRPIDRLLGLGSAAARRRSNLMSKAASWDPLGALLLPSSGTQPGDLRDDPDRRPADVEMARVVTRCRTLMKAPGRQVSSRCHLQERETRNGLEELHRPTCHHITTEGGCERSHVRTFLDGPFHVTDGRRNGKSGTSHSRQQSNELHHDQWRCTNIQELATESRSFDRLSARGADTRFQKLPCSV
jgi:hypothetical protein